MLGVAIIGCGDMGRKHAAGWNAQDGATVVTVCDHHPDRADALSGQLNAGVSRNWQEAITTQGVDIVSICVPVCDHAAVAVAAANAGRHVLCEKAMALTLAEADHMIAAAKANNIQLSVCHQYRALSRFRTMKRLIDDGRLGAPLFIRLSEMREVRPKLAMHDRGLNGGPVHDMTGHLFDLARYFTEAEPVSVTATGAVFGRGKARLESVSDFGIDTAEIAMRFTGGHVLTIGLNWGLPEGTPGHCHEMIHGPEGVAFCQDAEAPDRFLGDVSDTIGVVIKDRNGRERIACDPDDEGPEACVRQLMRAIRTGERSDFDGRQGRIALRMILASLTAIETGQTITI